MATFASQCTGEIVACKHDTTTVTIAASSIFVLFSHNCIAYWKIHKSCWLTKRRRRAELRPISPPTLILRKQLPRSQIAHSIVWSIPLIITKRKVLNFQGLIRNMMDHSSKNQINVGCCVRSLPRSMSCVAHKPCRLKSGRFKKGMSH